VRVLGIERAQQRPGETVENADQDESSAAASRVKTLTAGLRRDKAGAQIRSAAVAI